MDEFSIKKIFLEADPVVQCVMLLLVMASCFSWTVILEKAAVLHLLGRQIKAFKKLASVQRDQLDPLEFPPLTVKLVEAGLKESLDLGVGETRTDFRERAEWAMRTSLAGLLEKAEGHISLLATIGSTSPFIGLFGTVWGIMHSFTGIATTGETSLPVVAPGIAEALSATAIGLMAAIPAVIAFNKINSAFKYLTKEAFTGIGQVSNNLARLYFVGPKEGESLEDQRDCFWSEQLSNQRTDQSYGPELNLRQLISAAK
ncbi:MAG: MotA/TolQ/ExbB proton channel family protein [Deltaproteobacteria bacterium]|jgi:biopolymer transport protein ExbB/TolQ|nr:MotA/TolQ/ExbB proton channel family protein [Deltaproteobacteria bacterium]